MTTGDKDKESGEQLNQHDTDSDPPRSINSKTKTILGDSIGRNYYGNAITKSVKHKKHVVVKHFSGAKIDDMKHVKPTQEKLPAQIIMLLPMIYNKNSDEIASKIVEFANSIKICELPH